MQRQWYFIIGGAVVVVGIVAVSNTRPPQPVAKAPVHHHPKAPAKTHPKDQVKATKPQAKTPPIPKHFPTIPTSGTSTGSATASFKAIVGQAPSIPLQIVTPPWAKDTQWVVEPLGMKMNGNALYTLWFGDRTGSGPWHWYPATLPGEPPSAMPPAIRESLIMAYSLHLGDNGPSDTPGGITWQGLQGKVSEPEGWDLEVLPAAQSPLSQPSVGLTLYQQSFTGMFDGYYGTQAVFDAQNATNGLHGLAGFIARPGSLASIVGVVPTIY